LHLKNLGPTQNPVLKPLPKQLATHKSLLGHPAFPGDEGLTVVVVVGVVGDSVVEAGVGGDVGSGVGAGVAGWHNSMGTHTPRSLINPGRQKHPRTHWAVHTVG